MSTEIKEMKELINPHAAISDANLKLFYPKTHMKAVVDDEGNTLVNVFESFHDEVMEEASDMIADAQRDINTAISEYAPIEITGDVNNAADEEDLTSINVGGTEVIRLKDKEYVPTIYSGLGKKYLRKNTVGGVNILTQEMMSDANTIYHIQYDYDLNGETITVPENCVLEFEGGSLKNGELVGNGCKIIDYGNQIINNVRLINFNLDYIDVRWFGAKDNSSEDSAEYFQKALDMCIDYPSIPIKVIGTYTISSTVYCRAHFQLVGNNFTTRYFHQIDISEQHQSSRIIVSEDTTAFLIEGYATQTMYYCSFNIERIKFTGMSKNSSRLFEIKFTGAPSRPCNISYCEFFNFEYCIYFNPIESGGTSGTMIVGMSVNNNNAYANKHFIYSVETDRFTVANLHIYDNIIEQGYDDAIILSCPFSYINIENNIIEATKGYFLNVVKVKDDRICNIEVIGNYLEAQDKFININAGSSSGTTVNLSLHDNYMYKSTGVSNAQSTVTLQNVIINFLDSFENYKSDSTFVNCSFRKTANINLIPLTCLIGGNLFEELPCVNYPKFVSKALYPRNQEAFDTVTVSGKGILVNNKGAQCTSFPLLPDTVEGDDAYAILYNDTAINIGVNFVFGKSDNKLYNCRFPGFILIHKKYPENGGTTLQIITTTNATSAKIGISATLIESKKYADVIYLKDLSFCRNVINTSTPPFLTNNIPVDAYDDKTKKRVFYKNTKWVESDDATAGVLRSGTFANKPAAADIYVGFKYFCTDKQTAESATNGIEIIHKGSNVWVDALGRVVS